MLDSRYSDFRHVGPLARHDAGGVPDSTVVYGDGEPVKRYGGWEPGSFKSYYWT